MGSNTKGSSSSPKKEEKASGKGQGNGGPALFVYSACLLSFYFLPKYLSIPFFLFPLVWRKNVRTMGALAFTCGFKDRLTWFTQSHLYVWNYLFVFLEWIYFVQLTRPKGFTFNYVFLLGHPRSATTYSHHNINKAFKGQSIGMAHMVSFWPSLLLRKVIGPVRDNKNEDWEKMLNQHHAIQEFEEDDQMLGWGFYNHFPVLLYTPEFRKKWQPKDFMNKPWVDVTMLKRVMQIQMVRNHKQLWIGKPITHTVNYHIWERAFPGAQFVWCSRDVRDTLKSTIHMYSNLWPQNPERIFDCFLSKELLSMLPPPSWPTISLGPSLEDDVKKAIGVVAKRFPNHAVPVEGFKLSHPAKCSKARPPFHDPTGRIKHLLDEMAEEIEVEREARKMSWERVRREKDKNCMTP